MILKTTLISTTIALVGCIPAFGLTVQWPGAGKDATKLVQDAVNSVVPEIVLESHAPDEWILGQILCERSNQTILIKPGCSIREKRDRCLTVRALFSILKAMLRT